MKYIHFSGFGTSPPRPPIASVVSKIPGFDDPHYCSTKPRSVSQTTQYAALSTSYPGWSFAVYTETGGEMYIHLKADDGSDQMWAYPHVAIPCGGNSSDAKSAGGNLGTSQEAWVIKIQDGLNKYYLAGSPQQQLVLDGIFGPNTCRAAYGYQYAFLHVDSAELTPTFFSSLGIDAGGYYACKDGCKPWYAENKPQAGTSTPATPVTTPSGNGSASGHDDSYTPADASAASPAVITTPVAESTGFSWKMGLGLGLGLVAAGLLIRSIRKGKKGRK